MICMSASSDKRDLHLMCQLHFMADRTVAIIPLLPTFERATSILIVPPRVNSSAAQTQCHRGWVKEGQRGILAHSRKIPMCVLATAWRWRRYPALCCVASAQNSSLFWLFTRLFTQLGCPLVVSLAQLLTESRSFSSGNVAKRRILPQGAGRTLKRLGQ